MKNPKSSTGPRRVDPHLEDSVVEALRSLGELENKAPGHIEAVELAAWLDDDLTLEVRARVEAHLASCGECRQLVADAACAVRDDRVAEVGAAGGWSSKWAKWAMAAALLVALGGWLLIFSLDRPDHGVDGWRALGLLRSEVTPRLAALMDDALADHWPAPSTFGSFGSENPASTLRAASDTQAGPLPLTPRWSVVRDARPTFRWLPPSDPPVGETAGEGAPTRYEVLLVDADERLVFERTVVGGQGNNAIELPFPSQAAPLAAGAIYGWKVNALSDGYWKGSAFVPFRVLEEDARERLQTDLQAAGDEEALRGIVLASHGLYGEALIAFARLPSRPELESQRARFVERMLARQHFTDRASERIARRLSPGSGQPSAGAIPESQP